MTDLKPETHCEMFAKMARTDKNPMARIAAGKEILDRAYGKAPQPHDGDGQGGAITLMVYTGVPESDQ